MAPRAGVVSVDVEPNLSQVGSKIAAVARGLKPFGIKVNVDNDFAKEIDRGAQSSRRSLDGINTNKAQGELRQLGSTGERELGRIGSSAKLSSQALLTAGAGGIYAGTKIIGSLKGATDAASDLNEAVSYSGVVFGSSADEIDRWSDTSAEALGQSKRQATEAATTFATFGKAAGLAGGELVGFSTDLVKLATDLASAKNTSPEDAITAIGSALRGESEPIRAYGVLLDDATLRQEAFALGLTKTTKEALTPQQKVLAAQAAIFKQTGDAQGDFARTSDSAANSAKSLAASLEDAKANEGQGLLGVLSATNKAASTVLNTLGEIPGATAALGVATAGVGGAAIIGGAITSIVGARRAIQDYRTEVAAARSATSGIGSTGVAAFGKLGGAVQAVGGILAVAAIAETFGGIKNELNDLAGESQKAMDLFAANIDGGRTAVLSAFQQMVDVEDSSASIGDVFKSIGKEIDFAGVLDTVDIEYVQQAFDKLSLAGKKALIDAGRDQVAQLDKNSQAYIDTTALLDDWAEQLGISEKAQENNSKAVTAGTDKLDRFGFKIDETKGKYQQYADTLSQVIEPSSAAIDAVTARLDADKEVAEAEAEVARLRGQGNVDTEEAIDLANDLADAEARVAESKRSVAAAIRDQNDANRDLADLEAELAHVDPTRDPNRYRELAEKVRDAKDAQLDASDRVASAIESQRSAEQTLGETRSDQANTADELTDAEDRLADARQAQRDAILEEQSALAALGDALIAHPELVSGTFDAIDTWTEKGLLSADAARQWKEQILLVIAATQQLPQEPVPFPWLPPGFPTTGGGGGGSSTPASPPNEAGHGAESLSEAEGRARGLDKNKAIKVGAIADTTGQIWTYSESQKRWFATPGGGRLHGGPVDKYALHPVVEDGKPELLELDDGQTYLMTGDRGGRVVSNPQLQRAGSDLSSYAVGAGTAVLDRPTDTWAPVVEAINSLRADIANLPPSVSYTSHITAMPKDVGPTMDESFRASRRNSWETHGRRLPGA